MRSEAELAVEMPALVCPFMKRSDRNQKKTPFDFVDACSQIQSRMFALTLCQSVAFKHRSLGNKINKRVYFYNLRPSLVPMRSGKIS